MDSVRITGLWALEDKKGNTFLSGSLNQISNVFIMPNTFKKESKEPDYFLYFGPNVKKDPDKTKQETVKQERGKLGAVKLDK